MRKALLLMVIVAVAAMQALAGPVSVETARETASRVAQSFMPASGQFKAAGAQKPDLVHAEANPDVNGQALYYIFNTPDSYIIVAGDDSEDEVLAIGDSPIDMSNIPAAMRLWLECCKQHQRYLLAHPNEANASRRAPAREGQSVRPLLTALWNQDAPYYNQCPEYNGNYCLTGCPATSLAMVFYYWKYPTGLTPAVPGYTTRSLRLALDRLEPMTMDWDNMLDSYRGQYTQEQANAVAWLMRYVGQYERMDYTPDASGSYGDDIVRTIKAFGYDPDVKLVYKEWWNGGEIYSDEQWGALMQEELCSSRPMVMCAYTATNSGHAFNIDGYDAASDTYHINWGWGGSANGYCKINAFNGSGMTFNVFQQLIIGTEPPATEPTIRTRTTPLDIKTFVDSTGVSAFKVKGALIDHDITLTLDDPTGYFSLETSHIAVSDAQAGQNVRVSYSPTVVGQHTATVTLHSEGAEDKVVTLSGTSLLETYVPVMLSASDVMESSFNINWTDRTPGHNLVNYRLEVAPVPFHELRLEETFDKGEYSGTSTSDWASKLDEITRTQGWTGSKVYRSENCVFIGSSKSKGWLATPSLDMYGNNGLVTVKVTASSTGANGSAVLKIGCGDKDTTITVASDAAEYCVLLPCKSDMASVKFTSATGQRVIIYDVNVLAGDDYSPVDLSRAAYHEDITNTSYLLSGMAPGYYAMRVQARYTDGSLSPWSNRVRALAPWARWDVNHDGEVNVSDASALIRMFNSDGITPAMIARGDMNGDGEVNISDINAVIDRILGDE